jgi:prepilin-type N-terminal cleavage/methylation domain-containing protein
MYSTCIRSLEVLASMALPTETGRHTGRKSRQGFTLIELLVVMAIIATLLMIAVPRYFRSLEKAKEATLRQDLAVMRDAIDKYFGDSGQYPQQLVELVDRRYLRSLPVDPLTKSADSWVAVDSENPELPGITDIRSGAEGQSSVGTPYSEY